MLGIKKHVLFFLLISIFATVVSGCSSNSPKQQTSTPVSSGTMASEAPPASDSPASVPNPPAPDTQAVAETQHALGFKPGDIFREYVYSGPYPVPPNWSSAWLSVTDPNATAPQARERYERQVLSINIDDLTDAVRVEMQIEQWGGHAGTGDKKVRINDNEWLPIPESPYMGPETPEAYNYFRFPIIEIPLDQIKPGINTFEFGAGPMVAYDTGWGHWGVYGVIFRVYYSPDKPHPEGRITSPESGTEIGEKVTISADVKSTGSKIKHVNFIGYYEDFDTNGDGVYKEWHYNYKYGLMRYHLGTAKSAPYEITWDNSWVPDQDEPIKIMACITSEDGMTYVTPAVENLTLVRPDYSIKMYKPYDVPGKWVSRDGYAHGCKVDVTDDLSKAIDARMVLSTWNGQQAEQIGINRTILIKSIGLNHDYSCADHVPVPLDLIKSGTNVFFTKSTTKEHGIEVLWPGIALKVKYMK